MNFCSLVEASGSGASVALPVTHGVESTSVTDKDVADLKAGRRMILFAKQEFKMRLAQHDLDFKSYTAERKALKEVTAAGQLLQRQIDTAQTRIRRLEEQNERRRPEQGLSTALLEASGSNFF